MSAEDSGGVEAGQVDLDAVNEYVMRLFEAMSEPQVHK